MDDDDVFGGDDSGDDFSDMGDDYNDDIGNDFDDSLAGDEGFDLNGDDTDFDVSEDVDEDIIDDTESDFDFDDGIDLNEFDDEEEPLPEPEEDIDDELTDDIEAEAETDDEIEVDDDFEEELEDNLEEEAGDDTEADDEDEEQPETVERPGWRQSELDAAEQYPDYEEQKSFLNGEEVPYGTPGSSRPDLYTEGSSIEVKNYDVTSASGRNNLVNNVAGQVEQRVNDLPEGTKQTIVIDTRGQDVDAESLAGIRDAIGNKTSIDVEIEFMR